MIVNPIPGTRVKTGPNPSKADPPPPIKHGRVVRTLHAGILVHWDDGTETWVIDQWLDPE